MVFKTIQGIQDIVCHIGCRKDGCQKDIYKLYDIDKQQLNETNGQPLLVLKKLRIKKAVYKQLSIQA